GVSGVGAPARAQGMPGFPALPGVVAVGGIGPGPAQPGAPATLAFSPDGRALIGRAPDRSVRVWDVDSGKEVGRFKGHDGRVETVGFSPDGKTVVTGSSDTTLLLWDAATLRKDQPARQAGGVADGAAGALGGGPRWRRRGQGRTGRTEAGRRAQTGRDLPGRAAQAGRLDRPAETRQVAR